MFAFQSRQAVPRLGGIWIGGGAKTIHGLPFEHSESRAKSRTCMHVVSTIWLLAFQVLQHFKRGGMTWNFFSVRIKILLAHSENPSQSIKNNLFIFQFLKALIRHYNGVWPFFASPSFNHHPLLNEFRLWLCASTLKWLPGDGGIICHCCYTRSIRRKLIRRRLAIFLYTPQY